MDNVSSVPGALSFSCPKDLIAHLDQVYQTRKGKVTLHRGISIVLDMKEDKACCMLVQMSNGPRACEVQGETNPLERKKNEAAPPTPYHPQITIQTIECHPVNQGVGTTVLRDMFRHAAEMKGGPRCVALQSCLTPGSVALAQKLAMVKRPYNPHDWVKCRCTGQHVSPSELCVGDTCLITLESAAHRTVVTEANKASLEALLPTGALKVVERAFKVK